MTVKLHVDQPLNGTYTVKFDLPYASRTTSALDFAGDATVVWGPYPALLEGPLPMKVSVQSATDEAGQPVTIQISPSLPTRGIEYFASQSLSGSVGAAATLSRGTVAGLKWFAPLPVTDGFQQVLTTVKLGSVVTSTPFAQPVLSTSGAAGTSVRFQTLASSCRTNSSVLRLAGFDSYKVMPSSVSAWLKAETLVQSKSGEITSFVNRTLPRNFKQSMRPYDAARALFQAVVARIQYTAMSVKPDALTALRIGRGDCGYFSALFVACCRNIGIPARTVCGMSLGDNEWHVWSEFWIPGQGWVPADASYCDMLSPDGSLPLYFGTIPELNQRAAITYGFDHVASGSSMTMLQTPVLIASGSTRVSGVQDYCSLQIAPNP
jgi:hypothetical protein